MKKFLLSFFLIVPLLISLVPFSSSASQTNTNLEALPYSPDYIWGQIPDDFKDFQYFYENGHFYFNTDPSKYYFFWVPAYRYSNNRVEISYAYLSICLKNVSNFNSLIKDDIFTLSRNAFNAMFSYQIYNIDGFTFLNSNNGALNTFSFDLSSLEVLNSSILSPSDGWYWDFDHFYTNVDFIDIKPNALDVTVDIDPELSGDFSRKITVNNTVTTRETFNFSVINNSKFPIQYSMYIVSDDNLSGFSIDDDMPNSWLTDKTHSTSRVYRGDPSYVFLKNEWNYLPDGSGGALKSLNPCTWHYLSSKQSSLNTISFSQMKLSSGVTYHVLVYAVRNDLDCVSSMTINRSFGLNYPAEYCLNIFGDSVLVYSSEFTIKDPAAFDANANADSFAFDPDDDLIFRRSSAYVDENGDTIIAQKDTFKDFSYNPNSWGSDIANDPYVNSNAWSNSNNNNNKISFQIASTSVNINSFFNFISNLWSYFPSEYISVITTGLVAFVVLGILKAVF